MDARQDTVRASGDIDRVRNSTIPVFGKRHVPTVAFGRPEFVVAAEVLIGLSSSTHWEWASVTSRGKKAKQPSPLALLARNVPAVVEDASGVVAFDHDQLITIKINLSAHKSPHMWISGSFADNRPLSAVTICRTLREVLDEARDANNGESHALCEMLDALLGCIRPVLSRRHHQYSLSSARPKFTSGQLMLHYDPVTTAAVNGAAFSTSLGSLPKMAQAVSRRRRRIAGAEATGPLVPCSDGSDRLTTLPEELLIHILSFVQEPISLMNAMQTCSTMQRVGQDNRCWSFFPLPQKLLAAPYDEWSCYRRSKFYISFADEYLDLSEKWQAWRARVKELSPRPNETSPRHSLSRSRRHVAAGDSGSGVARTGRELSMLN